MDRQELRLEVLKIANVAHSHGPREVLARAMAFEEYVLGTPVAPAPEKVAKVEEPKGDKAKVEDKKSSKKTENPLS